MERPPCVADNGHMEVLLVDSRPDRMATLLAVTSQAFADMRFHSAATLLAGLQQARELERLDLVVLDLALPGCSGIQALTCFRSEFPSLRIVILDGVDGSSLAIAALAAGAVGYIPKTISLLATAAAIRLTGEAGTYLPSSHSFPGEHKVNQRPPQLKPRDVELLKLLAQGRDSSDIARELNVAESSVRQQMHDALRTLGATSRVEALVIAARRGVKFD